MNPIQRKNLIYSILLITVFLLVYTYRNFSSGQQSNTQFHVQGTTMGVVTYNVKYIDSEGRTFQNEIAQLLADFNQSLSTYVPSSEISRFNAGDTLIYESAFFYPVLKRSQEIWEITGGAFDPTIMPLVKKWGFGPGKEQIVPEPSVVDSLLMLVGFEEIRFDEKKAWKSEANVQLDFSAIAKGYAVDVVSDFLTQKGVSNFMVEIGGEVRCHGKKPNGESWIVGIENPLLAEQGIRETSAKVKLDNKALATSGNYRNFYTKDGKRYAHTLSPITGYPVAHSLLSASVFASDCMTADALATAFMVIGKDESIELLKELEGVEALLLYDEEGELKMFMSESLKEKVL